MKSTYKKIAVVSSAATALGLSTTTELVSEGYLVFACLDGNPECQGNYNILRGMSNVRILSTEINNSSAWRRIAGHIVRVCEELELEPRVDLLVNVPVLTKGSIYNSIPEYGLEVTLRDAVLKTFGAVEVLTPLLTNSKTANVVNIYPKTISELGASLVSNVATAALDSLTRSLAIQLVDSQIFINAVCPVVSAEHGFYNTSTLDIPGRQYILDSLKALVSITAEKMQYPTGQVFTITGKNLGPTKEVVVNA